MIGVFIIAHGTLGESLVHCASHVLNKRPGRLKQLGVTAQDDPPLLLPQARALVKELDDGSGVIILSDMYGGSPSVNGPAPLQPQARPGPSPRTPAVHQSSRRTCEWRSAV